MGQTSSHKHFRGDFAKSSISSQHNYPPSGYHPGGGNNQSNLEYGQYQADELLEDEGISCPTINPRSSYSPTDAISFRFPNNTPQQNRADRVEPNSPKRIPVVFKYAARTAKEIQLIGSFTNWKEKINMVKSDGDYCVIVDLPEGEHQYKFVVDGKWEHDPNQTTVDDHFSGKNNLVTVKKSDFEVMDALDIDLTATNAVAALNQKTNDDLSKSPPGEYTDEIPTRGLNSLALDKPPYLPPQLLNIVLNKDTSAKCEPALLPEPNHVMLKHLYALSIRDGVMVLSSTYRFKQKFVTTCFYKPI